MHPIARLRTDKKRLPGGRARRHADAQPAHRLHGVQMPTTKQPNCQTSMSQRGECHLIWETLPKTAGRFHTPSRLKSSGHFRASEEISERVSCRQAKLIRNFEKDFQSDSQDISRRRPRPFCDLSAGESTWSAARAESLCERRDRKDSDRLARVKLNQSKIGRLFLDPLFTRHSRPNAR